MDQIVDNNKILKEDFEKELRCFEEEFDLIFGNTLQEYKQRDKGIAYYILNYLSNFMFLCNSYKAPSVLLHY